MDLILVVFGALVFLVKQTELEHVFGLSLIIAGGLVALLSLLFPVTISDDYSVTQTGNIVFSHPVLIHEVIKHYPVSFMSDTVVYGTVDATN